MHAVYIQKRSSAFSRTRYIVCTVLLCSYALFFRGPQYVSVFSEHLYACTNNMMHDHGVVRAAKPTGW